MTETHTDTGTPPLEAPKVPEKPAVSKQTFRIQVWDHLEENNLVNFPRPVHGLIPNFKGTRQAARQLLELEEFKDAKSVEVNPDKPLEYSRMSVIENGKVLYVPVPRLQEGLLKKFSFCDEDRPKNIIQSVSRWGIKTLGKSVDFEDKLHIDLFVLGSVAVSKDGRRIGKGKGYADLEFAILKEMNSVDDDTVIVTTVHDSQVFDTLPEEIFEKYDVPIDYILTPTQIIKVEKKLPRPEGIFWNMLSQRRLDLMPILKKIREIHNSSGRDTTLKDVDTDVESEEKQRPRLRRYQKLRSPNRRERNEENGPERPRRGRYFRRSRVLKDRLPSNENENTMNKENENEKSPEAQKRPKIPRKNSRRLQVDFSLVVSNLDRNVRVRHLKSALIDHGIKPNNITWRGYKGFCYLHYGKPPKKETGDDADAKKPMAVDSIIKILETLKINRETDTNLSVKIMEPTRIETTDVTAV